MFSQTLNPSPTGDDWAQLTAAFASLRTAGGGSVTLAQTSSTPFNIKQCINGTSLANVDFRLEPGTTIRCDGFAGTGGPSNLGAPMFDFSGSSWFSVTGLGNFAGLIEGVDGKSPAGAIEPCCAILFANGDTKRVQDIVTSGRFSSSSLSIISCSDIDIIGGEHFNYDASAPVITMSANPDWNVWSPYTALWSFVGGAWVMQASQGFVSDVKLRTRIHGDGRQTWSTYIRNGQNIQFDHCLMDNNSRAQILVQGSNNSNISLISGKSYSELGVAGLVGVVECNAPDVCANLKMIGFGNGGIPSTLGSGNFAGLQVI